MSLAGLTCWLVDTRSLWLGERIETAASDVLNLLPAEEQIAIKAKHFIADAKLSLASALLKHLYVSRALSIPWHEVRYTRLGDPKHGKPAASLPDGSIASDIDFNVSHQAGLVALIGWQSPAEVDRPVSVGVDIVCVNERDDYRRIDADGFENWTEIYDAVFSSNELWDMKYNVDAITLPDGRRIAGDEMGRADRALQRHERLKATLPTGEAIEFASDVVIEAKLRRFYAYFAYKEAYIKLTGEALLAEWLTELEFHNVKSPEPGTGKSCSTQGVWGTRLEDAEVTLYGKGVDGVRLTIQAFEGNHMIATAVSGLATSMQLPLFDLINLYTDILPYATSLGSSTDSKLQ